MAPNDSAVLLTNLQTLFNVVTSTDIPELLSESPSSLFKALGPQYLKSHSPCPSTGGGARIVLVLPISPIKRIKACESIYTSFVPHAWRPTIPKYSFRSISQAHGSYLVWDISSRLTVEAQPQPKVMKPPTWGLCARRMISPTETSPFSSGGARGSE